jgi:HPt (histidine-containing phosphotransfer) domain-containing protein
MASLREQSDGGDPEQVRRVAHELRGASGSVGAVALQMTATHIEELAQFGDLVGPSQDAG